MTIGKVNTLNDVGLLTMNKTHIKEIPVFFGIYFSIADILLNFAFNNLKFWEAVDNISNKRTASQKYVLSISFDFMSKKGNFLNIFLMFFYMS